MKFSRFIGPMTAIVFGLSLAMPSMAATFSRGSSSSFSSSRSFSSSPPARSFAPSMPRAPSDSATRPMVAPPVASNNGFSKPPSITPPVAATTPPVVSNNGFSKPSGNTPTATVARSTPPPNALAAAQQKTMSANTLQQYQAQRASAKQPPMPVSTSELRNNAGFTTARRQYSSMDDYMAHRQTAYSSYRSSMSPTTIVIVNNMHPNYGMYDSSFLTGMIMGAAIIDMHNAAWLAAQQNQAWYPQYMADLQQQAQTNAELQARLDMLQQQMAQAKAQGISVDANQLPPGVDPSVAIAPEAMMADFSQTPSSNGNSHIWLWVFIIVIMIISGVVFVKVIRK